MTTVNIPAFRDGLRPFWEGLQLLVMASSGYEPLPSSPAEREIRELGDVQTIRTTIGQCLLLRDSAAEHVLAATRVLAEPFHTMASFTCVRTAMEVTGTVCWLLEPNVDHLARASRSVALRRRGLVEQKKLIRDCPATDDGHLAARFSAVEDKVRLHRLTPLQLPSATDIVSRTFGDPGYYRIAPAVVHGQPWALSQVGFVPAGREPDGIVILEKYPKPNFILYLLVLGLECMARSTWALAWYLGIDRRQLKVYLDKAYDELQFTGNRRFWDATG
jgi:hypothetical protein